MRPPQQQQASVIRRINSRAWLLAIVLLLFHAPVTNLLGKFAEAADLNLTIGGTATPGHPPQRGSGHQATPLTSGSAAKAVQLASAQIGKPYVWGDEGPGWFDCSGLAWYVWSHAGLRWERMTARDEYQWLAARGAALPHGATLRPGDLVFYDTDRPFGHVAIISAPGPHGRGVHPQRTDPADHHPPRLHRRGQTREPPMIPAGHPQVSVRRKVQLAPWFIIAVVVLNALHMLPGQGEENATPHQGGGAAHQLNPAAAARDDIPAAYLELYRAAARKHCPGLSWTILAGVGKVESNHGRANLPGVRSGLNSAGCCAGPMQFNLTDGPPSTWATYGHGSPYDPGDAIPAAARKLCADGAARPGGLVPAVAGYYGGTTANPPTAAYVTHVRCAARAYGAGTVRDLTRCFA